MFVGEVGGQKGTWPGSGHWPGGGGAPPNRKTYDKNEVMHKLRWDCMCGFLNFKIQHFCQEQVHLIDIIEDCT